MPIKQVEVELLPRVSVLERGQDAIQRDIVSLSQTVKEQGAQLSNAVIRMGEIHRETFDSLSKDINASSKTDWQTFWTMIGTIMLIIAAIMAPVWMSFNNVDKENIRVSENIKRINDEQIENIKSITRIETKLEVMEKVNEKNHNSDRGG